MDPSRFVVSAVDRAPPRAPYVANSALRRSLANEGYGVIRYDKHKATSGSLDPKGAFVGFPLGSSDVHDMSVAYEVPGVERRMDRRDDQA